MALYVSSSNLLDARGRDREVLTSPGAFLVLVEMLGADFPLLQWGIAVDDRAVYFTNTNSLRVPYKLSDGASTNNSAFGAVSLKDGSTLWLTAAPGGHSSFVAPTVVNDVILVGTTGLYINGTGVTPPGLLTPLDKTTGEVLRVDTLDAYFRGNLVAVHDYVMFGTGYQSSHPAEPGSFQVWKIMR